MVEIIEVLRQEHRNIEKLLHVLERELSVFDRGDRPDYEVVLAVIEYFKDYPDTCHHPKEDIIVAKLKARDPVAAAAIGDLEAEHREGARRLRQVAQAVERKAAHARRGIPHRGEHCQAAKRAAADFEGHSEAAKYGQPGRLNGRRRIGMIV
jgi:hemerythrin-like domain-containing protein